ncbi:hypothetical protein F3Y22_tig00110293pilonHSYRG00100 [Hibiscus syriacus]|uniref:DUF4283 domain-containing protein n=1 Tax=Hibiscus syriacus TaxID=106335 RepID=A0A6A3B844_HIBSY|nr:hypothetical protein F3Y22_tig00110293pilonHSYRG00100 [Hibiscus syriacus]
MDYTMQPEASDMEAEAVAVNNQGTGLGLNSPSPTNSKPTYASMAAKNTVQDPRVGFGYRFESDTVEVLDEDCIIDETGEFPTIKFSDRVHDQIDKSTSTAIIVRLLGRTIGYKTLFDRIHALWKPRGEIQLIDLENNYYLVKFEDVRDYSEVLTERSWTIYGNYLSSTLEQIVFHNGETSITSDYLASLTDTTVRLYYDK